MAHVRYTLLGLVVVALTIPAVGHAGPTCRELTNAPRSPHDATSTWARSIWSAITDAGHRLEPGLGDAALALVEHPANGAWFCRSRDTVFVSRALVDYAHLGRATDGGDFLAFVLAHELAHRRFDTQPRNDVSERCDGDLDRELRADERAAFLAALARNPRSGRGFSPWRLEREGTLARFLEDEHGSLHCATRRSAALRTALSQMEGFADIYEVALALAFSATGQDTRSLATDLLGQLDGALNPAVGWARVPELAALRALLHTRRAAGALGRSCDFVFARHALLSPFDALGTRGDSFDVAAELTAARTALAESKRRGVASSLVDPIAACLASLTGPAVPARSRPRSPSNVLTATLEALALAAELPCRSTPGSERVTRIDQHSNITVRERSDGSCIELEGADLRMLVVIPNEGIAASLDAWLDSCELIGRGRGDDRSDAVGLRCPIVDRAAQDGWTLFAHNNTVSRIIRLVPIQ